MIDYVPASLTELSGLPNVPTAWNGLEAIIPDIIQRFNLKTDLALEFGVFYGYSTAAFASYFKKVIGVDTFLGDEKAGFDSNMLARTRRELEPWPNVTLIQSDWEKFTPEWIRNPDIIHVDLFHTYQQTYDCGLWSVANSNCVVFHDTESYPEVKRAVADLAEMSGMTFYNYPYCYGLGILVKE